MKFTIAAVAALATSVAAIPAWAPEESATTTTTTTTTKPVEATSTSTWADWVSTTTTSTTSTTTKPVDSAATTWADWEEADSWTTAVVPTITTYVPLPTTIVHHGESWIVSSACTLTLTNGPFTVSVPVFTKTSTSCSEAATSTWADWESTSAPVAPATTTSIYVQPSSPVAPATFTGAANALVANVGAGLAGVGAIAAFLL